MVYEGDDSPGAKPTDAVGPFDTREEAEAHQERFKRLESWGYVVQRRKPVHVPIFSPDDTQTHWPRPRAARSTL
jgi:hypothetical protein